MLSTFRFSILIAALVVGITACQPPRTNSPLNGGLSGDQSVSGIVGGEIANPENDSLASSLAMLSIEVKVSKRFSQDRFCSAVLVAPEILMTAAHCVHVENGEQVFVRAKFPNAPEAEISISEIKIHENYRFEELVKNGTVFVNSHNDIALLKTLSSPPANKVAVAVLDRNLYQPGAPLDLRIYGFGAVKFPTLDTRPEIAYGTLRFVEKSGVVDSLMPRVFLEQNDRKGICSVDSGGPGFINVNHEHMVATINTNLSRVTARTKDNCHEASFLTLVGAHADWLNATAESLGAQLTWK